MFRVRLDNGHEALGYMGGRMKSNRIRVFPGDRVRIELSSYDLTRGRIVLDGLAGNVRFGDARTGAGRGVGGPHDARASRE